MRFNGSHSPQAEPQAPQGRVYILELPACLSWHLPELLNLRTGMQSAAAPEPPPAQGPTPMGRPNLHAGCAKSNAPATICAQEPFAAPVPLKK